MVEAGPRRACGAPALKRGEGRTRKRVIPSRDTDRTAFTSILDELVRRIPGAYAAALVDSLGECVDYTGRSSPFDIKLAGAHGQIMLAQTATIGALGPARWLIVRALRMTFVARALPDNYAVVVTLRKRAGFSESSRAFAACERALYIEADWGTPPRSGAWPVSVECNRFGRPLRLSSAGSSVPHAVEVIGAVVGLPGHNRGFRVRLESGLEVTLVREAGGFWYADEAFDPAHRP
jgi:hypothetical protein